MKVGNLFADFDYYEVGVRSLLAIRSQAWQWKDNSRGQFTATSPVRGSARDNRLDCSGASFASIEIQRPSGALA